MRFTALFAIFATFSVALASPTVVETRGAAAIAYYPITMQDGRTSAAAGSPNGLYMYHNETHAVYYGADFGSSLDSRSPSR